MWHWGPEKLDILPNLELEDIFLNLSKAVEFAKKKPFFSTKILPPKMGSAQQQAPLKSFKSLSYHQSYDWQ